MSAQIRKNVAYTVGDMVYPTLSTAKYYTTMLLVDEITKKIKEQTIAKTSDIAVYLECYPEQTIALFQEYVVRKKAIDDLTDEDIPLSQ